MTRRNWQISVFPRPDAVLSLGGYCVNFLDRAIDCWSQALGLTSGHLEGQFDRADFAFLFEALNDVGIEPDVATPNEQMAEAVEQAGRRPGLAFAIYGDETGQRVQKLADRVRGWDYLHAWALLWPLRCFKENCEGHDPLRVGFWKMEFVEANAHPRGKQQKQPA
jgi:hypothetical protein